MTNGQIALLLEALEACQLDEHFAGFVSDHPMDKPLTEAQRQHVMLYIESWIEPKIAVAIRLSLGAAHASSDDKQWASDAKRCMSHNGLCAKYERIDGTYYSKREARREAEAKLERERVAAAELAQDQADELATVRQYSRPLK